MKKLTLLLLDANVVIYLFKIDLWDKLIQCCDVLLSRIVAEREAQFYETGDGEKVCFDLKSDIDTRHITLIDVSASDMKAFRDRFDPVYLERLDDGETESLVYLAQAPDRCLICSADAIVFRVLALLGCDDQGLSLEEVLAKTGWGRGVPYQYSKQFREHWTKIGGQHKIQGRGLRPREKN